MKLDALDYIRQSEISVLRLRFTFMASARVALPPFLGSTLRGAFGTALKAASCLQSPPRCESRCTDSACAYGAIFEPHRWTANGYLEESPPAYVIRSTPAPLGHRFDVGDSFRIESLLYGPGVPLVLTLRDAFFRAGQTGFGVGRTAFSPTQMEVLTANDEWRFIPFDATDERSVVECAIPLIDVTTRRLSAINRSEAVHVRFPTPLRIRVAGKVRTDLPFHILTRAAANRVDELARAYGCPTRCVEHLAEFNIKDVRTERDGLRFNDWARYSNRQGMKMKLGGLTGDIVYRGAAIQDALPLLVAGETLHVGSSTAFGLGLYELSTI